MVFIRYFYEQYVTTGSSKVCAIVNNTELFFLILKSRNGVFLHILPVPGECSGHVV